jgi:hypothetical protein
LKPKAVTADHERSSRHFARWQHVFRPWQGTALRNRGCARNCEQEQRPQCEQLHTPFLDIRYVFLGCTWQHLSGYTSEWRK